MICGSMELSWWDALNGGLFTCLGSIDEEIIQKDQNQFSANNSPSNDARRMKIPPFDASRHDESDDMYFIFLQSVDMEYDQILNCKNWSAPIYICMYNFQFL